MRRNEEIKYVKAAAEFTGWIKNELYHFAVARNLIPEELTRRVLLGDDSGDEEFVSSVQRVPVHVPQRKEVRVQTRKGSSRKSEVENGSDAHGKTHRRKVVWTDEMRKAQGDRMRKRWRTGEFDHRRNNADI